MWTKIQNFFANNIVTITIIGSVATLIVLSVTVVKWFKK